MKPESKLMRAIFGEPVEDNGDALYYQEVDGIALHDALMRALDNVAPFLGLLARQRYKRVILLRFGFESPDGHGRTLDEVAGEFGVSRERVRQIEAKTLRLLRHPSRSRKLEEFIRK